MAKVVPGSGEARGEEGSRLRGMVIAWGLAIAMAAIGLTMAIGVAVWPPAQTGIYFVLLLMGTATSLDVAYLTWITFGFVAAAALLVLLMASSGTGLRGRGAHLYMYGGGGLVLSTWLAAAYITLVVLAR